MCTIVRPITFPRYMLIRHQDEEGNYKLPASEVATIKQELIRLMISVEPNLQSQLGEAISLIADSDFWQRWNTLVDVSLPNTEQYFMAADTAPGTCLALDA